MSGIFGILGLADTDRSFINALGQTAVFEAANEYLRMANQEMAAMYSVFIEEETEGYKERYYLPGGGRLQKRGGQAQSGATAAAGSWDVAFPLEDFGAQFAGDRVTLAYMTLQQLQRHIDTIRQQSINTMRFEILKRLFNNTAGTFTDALYGSLTIQGLANGDSVTYPPVMGSEVDATADHCIESGYLASAISDTNNPFTTIRQKLEGHFGTPQGFGNIAVFINPAQVAKTEALGDYDPVPDSGKNMSITRDNPYGIPTGLPGRVIGRSNGVWVIEWGWVPANYMLGIDLEQPGPLKVRVDPASTTLPRGLNMVAENDKYPLQSAHYAHRFGVGAGNRLNGVAFELGNGGSYTIPSAYQ